MAGDAAADLLGLVARGSALVLDASLLDGSGTGACDGSNIAKVGVDTDEGLAVVCLHVLDHDVALARGLAVAASTVQLAKVNHSETVDRHRTDTVVLDNLVISASSTTIWRASC